MPVENARIFMNRFQVFMEDYVMGGPHILGEVEHFVHRFELQGRGFLWKTAVEEQIPDDSLCNRVPGPLPNPYRSFSWPGTSLRACQFFE